LIGLDRDSKAEAPLSSIDGAQGEAMANTITATMTNDTVGQQVFFATDNVMQAPAPIEGQSYPGGYPVPPIKSFMSLW
jgi:hypothetical protein